MFKYLSIALALIVLGSCSSDEKTFNVVDDSVTFGAYARLIGEYGEVSNGTSTNRLFYKDGTETPFTLEDSGDGTIITSVNQFSVDVELKDEQNGALLQSIEVYTSFSDNTILLGETMDISVAESFVKSIPASDFSTGANGLPVATIALTSAELFPGVDFANAISTDEANVRIEVVLTDGRVFSSDDTNDNVGGLGTFYNSPYEFSVAIDGLFDIQREALDPPTSNEINLVPGSANGYGETVTLIDPLNQFQSLDVFLRLVDNTTVLPTDNDVSFDEILLETALPGDFIDNMDGNPAKDFEYDEMTILNGLTFADLKEGDTFILRYAANLADGSSISFNSEPYEAIIPVVDCPAPAIADLTTFGVGTYALTIVDGVFPDFGATIDWIEEDVEIISTGGTARQIVSACFLPEFGTFCGPLDFEFVCQNTTMPNQSAGGGVGCGGPILVETTSTVSGEFDSTNDDTFTLSFIVTAEGSGTTCPSAPYASTIQLTRVN